MSGSDVENLVGTNDDFFPPIGPYAQSPSQHHALMMELTRRRAKDRLNVFKPVPSGLLHIATDHRSSQPHLVIDAEWIGDDFVRLAEVAHLEPAQGDPQFKAGRAPRRSTLSRKPLLIILASC